MNLINANGYNNNGSYYNKSNSSLTNNNGIDNNGDFINIGIKLEARIKQ